MDYTRIRNNWAVCCLIALAIAFVVLAHEVSVTNAIMVDEYAHLPAGVSYWDLGRFYIYRENPPLVQARSRPSSLALGAADGLLAS